MSNWFEQKSELILSLKLLNFSDYMKAKIEESIAANDEFESSADDDEDYSEGMNVIY